MFLGELLLEVGILVVDGNVESELLNQPLALCVAAGKTNDASALELGNLAGDAAGGTSGTGHDNRLTSLGLANLGHADPGGDASHAEDGEHVLGVAQAGVVGGRLEGALAEDGVLGPAGEAADEVASGGLLALGGEDAADGGAAHDLADLNGRKVRASI
ncbi:hypothetical protein MKX07_007350 [Trichoderma sp. CBMAI-0711]|nr:hypothetical protein MKX07_007350 [Trichoderma sp. CBMAI-0711]